ncbi:unnamed protein product [Symbiodinium necroappetens]|uniref:RanBP2-type domain-containing protein n=1 Tax=Symbiodinium necroappetens TaxID=1628268 RepID=A0A812IXM4_9DINO|nr:unnamed protein product [Symbiodinium necroappetens]
MGKAKHQVTADGRCKRERKKDATREEVIESWRCDQCNFENDASLPFCEMCGASRKDREEDSEGDDIAEWSCNVCSFKNIGLLPYCEVCEAPRSGGDSSAAASAEAEWECPLCSFRNPSHRTACAMCNAPRPAAARATPATGSSASQPAPAEPAEEEEPAPCTDEERRLLMSMGWNPEDGDEEEGLEDWEIDAAQENLIGRVQARADREGLRERAQREFEAWKAQ